MMSTPAQAPMSSSALKQLQQQWEDDEPLIKIPRFSFAQAQAINNGLGGGKFIAPMGGNGVSQDYGKKRPTFQFIDEME